MSVLCLHSVGFYSSCNAFCSDGGEEEAVGQNGSLAAAQHCGQSCHQETGREVPQEEGCHHGNKKLGIFCRMGGYVHVGIRKKTYVAKKLGSFLS